MNALWEALGVGLLLGLSAAVLPCPLTGNLAALALIVGWGRGFARTALVGSCLVAGMVLTYAGLGIAIASAAAAAPGWSQQLPLLVTPFLGPFLILAGMFQTGA